MIEAHELNDKFISTISIDARSFKELKFLKHAYRAIHEITAMIGEICSLDLPCGTNAYITAGKSVEELRGSLDVVLDALVLIRGIKKDDK